MSTMKSLSLSWKRVVYHSSCRAAAMPRTVHNNSKVVGIGFHA